MEPRRPLVSQELTQRTSPWSAEELFHKLWKCEGLSLILQPPTKQEFHVLPSPFIFCPAMRRRSPRGRLYVRHHAVVSSKNKRWKKSDSWSSPTPYTLILSRMSTAAAAFFFFAESKARTMARRDPLWMGKKQAFWANIFSAKQVIHFSSRAAYLYVMNFEKEKKSGLEIPHGTVSRSGAAPPGKPCARLKSVLLSLSQIDNFFFVLISLINARYFSRNHGKNAAGYIPRATRPWVSLPTTQGAMDYGHR